MHMSHIGPGVLEVNSVLEEFVLEDGHLVDRPGWSDDFPQPLERGLHVIQLVHYDHKDNNFIFYKI